MKDNTAAHAFYGGTIPKEARRSFRRHQNERRALYPLVMPKDASNKEVVEVLNRVAKEILSDDEERNNNIECDAE